MLAMITPVGGMGEPPTAGVPPMVSPPIYLPEGDTTPPGVVWPPLAPDEIWPSPPPVDPGYGQGRPVPPTVGGGPSTPPGRPVAPDQPPEGRPPEVGGGPAPPQPGRPTPPPRPSPGPPPRPDTGPVEPPAHVGGGPVVPPVGVGGGPMPGHRGKAWVLCLIATARGVSYRYTVVDFSLSVGHPLPPTAEPK